MMSSRRGVGDLELLGLEAVLLELPRDQVTPGDLELLHDRVAGDVDDLHPVAQRDGDGVGPVGRADEQDLGQVEGHVEVVVDEGVVLFRVEHLQQGAGWVAAEVRADLVDLVEHEDGVVAAGLADLLDDPAGHGADVGAAVAADVGLVADAAEAHADELAAQGAGDGLAQTGLAHAGRPEEAEDRPAASGLQLADGEELEDAFLDRSRS